MDFDIGNMSARAIGDNARVANACATALAAEGVRIMTTGSGNTTGSVDILIVALRPSYNLNVASLDAEADALVENWDRLSALCGTIQTAIGGMVKRRFGRLIFIGSIAAKTLAPDALADRILGLGALGLQKNLAGEYGESGITANSILCDDTLDEAALLENVGAACVYLASREAAYLTGVVMTIDGGKTRSLF